MPFKHNAARRHRIETMKFKVTNWREYEAGLCRRGSLTLWVTSEALSSWQAPRRTTRGGQPRYSDLAIETALTLGLVFGLRLRQTEGLLTSVLQLKRLDLAVPDHTTLSRRARTGRSPYRRQVRSLSAEEPSQVEPLLDRIDAPIGQFTADGAYDGNPTYAAVTRHSSDAAVVIPPRSNAVDRSDTETASQRDRHIAAINTDGRMKWQAATGYGKRSLVETAIGRYKSIIGRRLRARSFGAQQAEVAIGCAVLNRMLECARPKSVRRIGTTA
jgi:hypothetical protein